MLRLLSFVIVYLGWELLEAQMSFSAVLKELEAYFGRIGSVSYDNDCKIRQSSEHPELDSSRYVESRLYRPHGTTEMPTIRLLMVKDVTRTENITIIMLSQTKLD